jgi:biopolymer transport protein ExbB/biopolymer transport protein TolQ
MLDTWLNWLDADGCVWGLWYLWGKLDWFGHAAVILLALMLANTIVIVGGRLFRYSAARRQSRAFIRDAADPLRYGRFDKVIAIAVRNSRSHMAAVVAAGLAAFSSAPPEFTDAEAIAGAERAFQRSRKMLAADLKHGLGTLSTIASSAPFIGLVGTVFGILGAFGGTAMEKSTYMRMVASSLSDALATTAMGLLVAVPAVWCRNYFFNRVSLFESEMSNAALEAVTYLNAHPQWRNQPEPSAAGATSSGSGILRVPSVRSWEVHYDRQWALLSAMWCCALYVAFIFAHGAYSFYSWQRQQEAYVDPVRREYVGGQELVSPDRRYRAAVPVMYRERKDPSDKGGSAAWTCYPGPLVTLTVVPNDRPLAWKPYACRNETTYALEPDEALLTWNCSIPVITWRTNDELLVQCSDCSADNLQMAKPGFFPHKITVLGPDGKRIDPQIVHPQPQCW